MFGKGRSQSCTCVNLKVEGCLLFKEFGLLIDSNTIGVKERTSVDVHGLGQEVTWELHSIVSLHQKWHNVFPKEQAILLEQTFPLLQQS